MAISFLVLFAVPGCFCCNARAVSRNRAKVVEEYVVSANFDENPNFAQLSDGSQPREIYHEEDARGRQEVDVVAATRGNHRHAGELPGGADRGAALEERDYLVHHHHLPPVPPPPPPPPAPLAHAPSLYAVGLITFLILLNSLQTSLLIMKGSKGSILGTVGGVLGRRKRFVQEDAADFRSAVISNSTWRTT